MREVSSSRSVDERERQGEVRDTFISSGKKGIQSCACSGDSELGRVSSGWITIPSLSKFSGG